MPWRGWPIMGKGRFLLPVDPTALALRHTRRNHMPCFSPDPLRSRLAAACSRRVLALRLSSLLPFWALLAAMTRASRPATVTHPQRFP